MSTSGSSQFASVIEEHLELKRRNARLDGDLPLDEFVGDDPFDNHPLFKTEEAARREEEETGEHPAVALEIPAETLELPVVEVPDEESERERERPQGWMETTASQEFTWE
jgi:hypothetical protein